MRLGRPRPATSFPKPHSSPTTARCSTSVANEFDAVVVSTPDHSHALPAALAMTLGKHVYCEKPLTPSVERERASSVSSRPKSKLVTQMGTQIHAGDNYRRVVEIVQAGLLGPVKRVHVWNSSKPVGGKKRGAKPSAKFDLDLWLGPNTSRILRGRDEQVGLELQRGPTSTGGGGGSSAAAPLPTSAATTSTCRSGRSISPLQTSSAPPARRRTSGDNATPDVMQVDYQFPTHQDQSCGPPDVVPRRRRPRS